MVTFFSIIHKTIDAGGKGDGLKNRVSDCLFLLSIALTGSIADNNVLRVSLEDNQRDSDGIYGNLCM